MSDIAKEAGVSRLTVSAVLNGRRGAIRISDATRERVAAVAKKLKYRPNAIARAVRNGSTRIIGVIGPFHGGYGLDMLHGIVSEADRAGFSCKLRIAEPNKNLTAEDFSACMEYCVCGIICRSGSEAIIRSILPELERENILLILLDASLTPNGFSVVNSDDFRGGVLASEFLLKNGYKRILYSICQRSQTSPFAQLRLNGFEKGLGHVFSESEKIYFENFEEDNNEEDEQIFRYISQYRPEVIFCDNDYSALKTISLLHRHNVRVPEDISVMGFGDLEFSGLIYPRLTTVKQPFFEMGRTAVSELQKRLSGGENREIRLKTELVIRDSVKVHNKKDGEK